MDGLRNVDFNKNWIAPQSHHGGLYYYNLPIIDMDSINKSQYQELLNEILEFSFNNNSSKKTLDYILSFT
jgi:hypothetical protein